jgi:hypothetical protein
MKLAAKHQASAQSCFCFISFGGFVERKLCIAAVKSVLASVSKLV